MGHKWEYKKVLEPSEERMNTLGADNWELFAVHGIHYIFRRYVEDLEYLRVYEWVRSGFSTDGAHVCGGRVIMAQNDVEEWVMVWVAGWSGKLTLYFGNQDILTSTIESSPKEILTEIRMRRVHSQ